MATKLEDVELTVKLDIGPASKDLTERTEQEAKRIQEAREREKEEARKAAERARGGVFSRAGGILRGEVAGLGLGVSSTLERGGAMGRSVEGLLGSALFFERVLFPVLQGLRDAQRRERAQIPAAGPRAEFPLPQTWLQAPGEALRRAAVALRDRLGPQMEQVAVVMEEAALAPMAALARGILSVRTMASAASQTAEDSIALAKGVSLLGLDLDGDFLTKFMDANFRWNHAMGKLQRLGERKATEMVTEAMARTVSRSLGGL